MISKLAQLVERVHGQTLANEVKWQATEEEGVFQLAFPKYALRISARQSRQPGDDPDYVLTIYNDSGTVIEDVADPELAEEADIGYDPYRVMKETYDRARGQAMGIDEALDDLLKYFSK